MPIKVICQICENAVPPRILEFQSKLITSNVAEQIKGIAEEIVPHLSSCHPDVLIGIQQSMGIFPSFLFLNEFRAADEDQSEVYEVEKEKMRDGLIELVMKYAKETDDEDEDSEEDEEDSEDMFDEEPDEDESEETEETRG